MVMKNRKTRIKSRIVVTLAGLFSLFLFQFTYAREAGPFIPPGGLSMQTKVGSTTMDVVVEKSENALSQNQINAPNGVVGLDAKKIASVESLVVKDGDNNRLIQLKDGMPALSDGSPDYIAGAETVFMGGYIDPYLNTLSRSLYISGRPYGPMGAGCVVCLINSQDDIQGGGGRPAISGVDYRRGGAAIAEAGGFDQVGLYEYVDNTDARIVAEVASYESKRIILKNPLTRQQMRMIHPSMYIQTNSIETSLDDNDITANRLPRARNYVTYVDHVDKSTPNIIYTTGWAVPGVAETIDHIPGTTYDTWSSDYKKPMAFVGEPGKSFGRNLFMSYNGSKTTAQAKSLIHAMEAEEIDMFIHDELRPHHVSLHGITISPLFANQNPDVLTSDSYDMMLAGDIPNHLIIGEAPYNNVIKANAFYVHGNEGVGLAQNGAQQKRIGLEHDQWSDGAHQFRFVNYLSKDGTSNNWPDTSLRLGLLIDGNQGDISTGVNEGEIKWGGPDNTGGIALCGGSGNCGLAQKWDGSVTLNSTYVNPNQSLRMINGSMLVFQSASNPNAITINEGNDADLFFGSQSTGRVNLKGLDTITLNALNANGTVNVSGGAYDPSTDIVSGQGTVYGWNIRSGDAASVLVNISPAANQGGFKLYSLAAGEQFSGHIPIWRADYAGNTVQAGSMQATDGVFSGKAVFYPNGNIYQYPYLTAKDADTITGGNAVGHKLIFEAGTLHATDNALFDNGAVFSPTVFTALGAGYNNATGTQKYCSDCYSTANANHTKGIPVWWNGTSWIDALGNEAGR